MYLLPMHLGIAVTWAFPENNFTPFYFGIKLLHEAGTG